MDPLDRLLRDDLDRLLDRLASPGNGGRPGSGDAIDAGLRSRLDEAEAQLSAIRLRLLEEYEEWRRAMDACEDLWALARLREGESSTPDEATAAEVLRAA